MDYDILKTNIQNAYNNFRHSDNEFYSSMNNFYKEGKKNPSVARMILQDQILKGQKAAIDIINEVPNINFSGNSLLYNDMGHTAYNKISGLALKTAILSVNAQDIYKSTENIEKRKDFDKEWERLYPKTGKLRERIIEANRLSIDSTTPKADWYEKINYAKTLNEYRKDYPKTFFTRYTLIMNDQIKEGNVTPKVKNWFKRLSYKFMIKNGFCFKK